VKRILFVDDEPHVLEGLRGILRKQRRLWEMTFVHSGEEALRALAAAPHDVIVSDMRMPGMDGATLLRTVQRLHPEVVRIVLSGQTDQQVSRRMIHVAHQFMSKPCDGRDLEQVIERALALFAWLPDPALRRVVGQIGQLPVAPLAYRQLLDLLASPGAAIAEVAAVIEKDVGLLSKILQMVSAAPFGSAHPVTDARAAATILGAETILQLASSAEMREAQLPEGAGAPLAGAAPWLHEEAGRLAVASQMPDASRQIGEAAGRGCPVVEAERDVLGVTRADLGAYLLGIWGLPAVMVEAVAQPPAAPPGGHVGAPGESRRQGPWQSCRFPAHLVARRDLQLELHLDSNPRLVSVVRRFIEEALEKVVDDDEDLVGRLSMAAHELVENGIKYALCDPTIMRIGLEQGTAGVRARIAVTNQASVEHVDRLRSYVSDIGKAGAVELPELYESYLRRREPNGGSGVGLVRIRAEAAMSLDMEVNGSMVTIIATALLKRRSS
jgi:DNA-binding NarL/FixJ family response regulator/anti-sigma regulatory factor (Ser/Thr protein kinase)